MGWPDDRKAIISALPVQILCGAWGVDCIHLYQLHSIDEEVPLEESLGALKDLQDEGKIRHIGVSNFSVEELDRARKMIAVVTVQNRYNLVLSDEDFAALREAMVGYTPA